MPQKRPAHLRFEALRFHGGGVGSLKSRLKIENHGQQKRMKQMKAKPLISISLAGSVVFLVTGCAVPTRHIQRQHWELNGSIHTTTSEQLLLNIVRLRYDESPFFLQLSSISTTFAAQQNLGVSGQIPEGGPNALGLSGGVSYMESPTVTWSLPDSSEYYGRLLSPKSRQPGQCLPFGHETSRPGIGVVAVLAMNQRIC